jgi:hypothetical protein
LGSASINHDEGKLVMLINSIDESKDLGQENLADFDEDKKQLVLNENKIANKFENLNKPSLDK